MGVDSECYHGTLKDVSGHKWAKRLVEDSWAMVNRVLMACSAITGDFITDKMGV